MSLHYPTAALPSHPINIQTTGCPKIKSALGKHLEVAIHGFKLCILYCNWEKYFAAISRKLGGVENNSV